MLERLHLRNFAADTLPPGEEDRVGIFLLRTCQRDLLVDWGELPVLSAPRQGERPLEKRGEDAYLYLLEVICGMQSRVQAESEIVGQFKQAYWEYLKDSESKGGLVRILEKLFQDAKDVRTRYLEGVEQKTYAAITRKIIFEKAVPKRVLVVGTGQLALDVVNQLRKRVEQIFITSRNREKVQEFCHRYLVYPLEWRDFALYGEFSSIVNTVGTRGEILFDRDFFDRWHGLHSPNSGRTFVDLGHPSSIETHLGARDGVFRLEQVFQQSAIREREKKHKIEKAQAAIRDVSKRRSEYLIARQREWQFV